MTSQVQDPSIPSKSGKCHFFRLPPELRTVIYDLILGDFVIYNSYEDFEEVADAEDDWDDENDWDDEDDGDAEIDLDESEDADEQEAQAAAPMTEIAAIMGIDIDTGVEKVVTPNTSNMYPRLNRLQLIDTCRLIRQEVGPLYNHRMTMTAVEVLQHATLLLAEEQEWKHVVADRISSWSRDAVSKEAHRMRVQTRECVDGMELGIDGVQSEKSSATVKEALENFEALESKLSEVSQDRDGQV